MRLKDILKTDLGKLARTRKVDDADLGRRAKAWRGPRYLYDGGSKHRRDLTFVLEHLTSLVRLNAPLVDGIDAVSLDAPNRRVEAVLLTLRDDLANGVSMADAMALRTRFFPRHIVDIVRIGEETGQLAENLDNIRSEPSTGKKRNAIVYFLSVLIIQLGIGYFVAIKVLPVLQEILSDVGCSKDAIAYRLNNGISTFAFEYAWRLPIWALAIAVVVVLTRKSSLLCGIFGNVFARVPFVGAMWVRKKSARLGRMLAAQLSGGIPIDEAVWNLADSKGLGVTYQGSMSRVFDRVHLGSSMRDAFEHERHLLPAFFRSSIAVGEDSGRLPGALRLATETCDSLVGRDFAVVSALLHLVLGLLAAIMPLVTCIVVYSSLIGLADSMLSQI